VTLTEKPGAGRVFTGWSGGGCSGSAKTCQVVMSANRTVRATFKSIPPPDTVITAASISSAKRTATFSFKGSGGAGPLHFKCKLDGGSFGSCSSPKTYGHLAKGSHTFKVEAVDTRGVTDPSPAVRSFHI
jgi:hypothetical protein